MNILTYEQELVRELRQQAREHEKFRELVREMRITQEQVRHRKKNGMFCDERVKHRNMLEAQVDGELHILATERTVA